MRLQRAFLATISLVASCTSELPSSTSALPLPSFDTTLAHQEGLFLLDNAPVQDVLSVAMEQWIKSHSAQFQGNLAIQLSGDDNIVLLREAVHNAKTAGFHTVWLAVQGRQGATRGIKLSLRPPKPATREEKKEAPKEQAKTHWANPKLIITPEYGFVLSAFDHVYASQSESPPFEKVTVLGCEAYCFSENYPYVELSRMVRRLKLDHPGDRSVIVQTTENVTVQTFVSALDAVRDDSLTGRHRMDMFSDPIYDYTEPKQ